MSRHRPFRQRTRMSLACGLLTLALSGTTFAATITLSGTLTNEETSQPIAGVSVRAARVASLGSGQPSNPIPVEATVSTNSSGYYQIQVTDSTPDLDRVLVFTDATGFVDELYDNVQFLESTPTYADVQKPGVVHIDFRNNVSNINFALEPSSVGGKTTYMVEMSDGIRLATDVYLPDGNGPWPVVLYRTPYGKNSDYPSITWCERGYVIVAQDCRGRFDSEGVDHVFYDDGWGTYKDGYETCLWILSQPWCNGKIGTIGGSARGITQNMLAGSLPPGLICQHVSVAASNLYSQAMYQGGSFRKALVEDWLSGQGSIGYLPTLISHPNYDDEFWSYYNPETRHALINVPAVNVGGWYDIFLQGTINSFVNLQSNSQPGSRGKQKLVIEPYGHGYGEGGFYWPPNCRSAPAAYASESRWLDYWMKGIDTGVMDQPPVCYYALGDVDQPDGPGNQWRFATDWPVPATEVPLYFHAGGPLDTVPPTPGESPDTYVYDPMYPVPTLGGSEMTISKGPYDQRPVESRDDVMVFTTPVLENYVEITGKVLIRLYASSSALDTDFTGKLCDVYPDGRSMLVCDGVIRARHRNTMRYDEPMVPGTIYEFEIDLWETCIVFNAGHRIRVALSSSNYPRFDPNPNTGEPFRRDTHTVPATNTIYHDAAHPSHILLRATGPDSTTDGIPDIADLDSDGLPDSFEWRIINFDPDDDIRTLQDIRGEDDFDGDGYSNYDEYRHGSDPTQPTPALPVSEFAIACGALALTACAFARARHRG